MQKSIAFLNTYNELAEREIKKKIPFTVTSKGIKYMGVNLTQEEKDLYSENFKALIKESEEDESKWKSIPCL